MTSLTARPTYEIIGERLKASWYVRTELLQDLIADGSSVVRLAAITAPAKPLTRAEWLTVVKRRYAERTAKDPTYRNVLDSDDLQHLAEITFPLRRVGDGA